MNIIQLLILILVIIYFLQKSQKEEFFVKPIEIYTSGRIANNIIYFNNLTYKKNEKGGFDISINNPLKITHNLSIPGMLGSHVIINIDNNWNITANFFSEKNHFLSRMVYGDFTITTHLQDGDKITKYNSKCCDLYTYGERDSDCGSYSCMSEHTNYRDDVSVSIQQQNNNGTLTFKDINKLLTIKLNSYEAVVDVDGTKSKQVYQVGGPIQISDTLSYG